jgi:hypothetical protein
LIYFLYRKEEDSLMKTVAMILSAFALGFGCEYSSQPETMEAASINNAGVVTTTPASSPDASALDTNNVHEDDLGALPPDTPDRECETSADCGDDGNICNGMTVCQDGVCVEMSKPLVCPDSTQCVTWECHPSKGCLGELRDACSDGDPCTTGDHCSPDGTCIGEQIDCSSLDGDCTTGVCDTGSCVSTAWNDGGVCDDGDEITVGDYCDAGSCVAGTVSVVCDDDNPCTEDSWNSDLGACSFAYLDDCVLEVRCVDKSTLWKNMDDVSSMDALLDCKAQLMYWIGTEGNILTSDWADWGDEALEWTGVSVQTSPSVVCNPGTLGPPFALNSWARVDIGIWPSISTQTCGGACTELWAGPPGMLEQVTLAPVGNNYGALFVPQPSICPPD